MLKGGGGRREKLGNEHAAALGRERRPRAVWLGHRVEVGRGSLGGTVGSQLGPGSEARATARPKGM